MDSEVQIVRAILRQNEVLLRRHLILSRSVLDKLREQNLISDFSRRKILLEPAHRQVPALISCLENRGMPSLRKFMDVLRETGHGWIVEQLMDTDISLAGKGRIRDDIGYRDRHEPSFSRTQDKISDYFNKRSRPDPLRGEVRRSYTERKDTGLSLAALLKLREPVDEPEAVPRGVIHARTMFTDPIAQGYPPHPALLAGLPNYGVQPSVPFPRSKEEIPMTLLGLNQVFSDQDQKNQQTLSVLRQEEVAIRQLMEQNIRDQGNLRKKQAAVHDIVNRLKDIHYRAKDVYDLSPQPNISRYRLAQLNQIPWSIDG